MKRLWLIIPLLLTVLPVLLIPAAAENQFVDFDFSYYLADNNGLRLTSWVSGLYKFGYIDSDHSLTGLFHRYYGYFRDDWHGIYSPNGVDLYSMGGTKLTALTSNMGDCSFTCNNEEFYQWLVDNGYGSYCIVHYRFVLDYFPTDVLSYFFYGFFENNYIMWCIGIWILAIAFKLLFSHSGVLKTCMTGF